jgi:uncharacterized membrane protein YoaK (UPF0700 family)
MTGNVLILAFATARVPGLSVARSSTALIAFFVGAILGGRISARASDDPWPSPKTSVPSLSKN